MPDYISIGGKWKPRKEYVINPGADVGENPVYEGECRAGRQELETLGVEYLGKDALTETQTITRARQLGYDNVKDYLKAVRDVDYDKMVKEQESRKDEEVLVKSKNKIERRKNGKVVESKQMDSRKSMVTTDADSMNRSKKDMVGGFGTPKGVDLSSAPNFKEA